LAERALDCGWGPDPLTLFCPRCGATTGPFEAGASGCSACRAKRLRWQSACRVGEYRGLLRDAIHEVKFQPWRRLGTELGVVLGRQLQGPLAAAGVDPDRLVLVPMPTSLLRRLTRGIHHTLAIARGVRMVTGGRIVHVLRRAHRPSQVSLSQTDRLRNVAGSMRRRRGLALAGHTVVVIDDVMTTGATMKEACRALIEGTAGPGQLPQSVWAAVLAVATDPERRPANTRTINDGTEPGAEDRI